MGYWKSFLRFKSNKMLWDGDFGVRNNEIGIISKIGKVDKDGIGYFEARIHESANEYRTVKIETGGEQFPISFSQF